MIKLKMQKKKKKKKKKMIIFNLRILSRSHACLQTRIKTPVQFQKTPLKTVGGAAYTQGIHFLYTLIVYEDEKWLTWKCGNSDTN